MNTRDCRLMALIGPGRSGTTWAGALLDSCPEVIYRFEPFHRMARTDATFREWFDRLKQGNVTGSDLPRIYELLRTAHPLTNKPPYFPDKRYRQVSAFRERLWPAARALRLAAKAYGWVYSPPSGPPLVFKEVTFVKPLRTLVEKTSMPIVYLVRHPCATVMSDVTGQRNGKMPQDRQRRLGELLRQEAPELADRFADVVAGTDIVQRTALLWRYEIESCVPLVQQSTRGMLLTNEQLADDAHVHAKAMLQHFGLEYSDQTRAFIDSLYEIRVDGTRGPARTGWGDKYFSVFRNPREEKDAWKTKISAEDRSKIEAIVADSDAVALCAKLGSWQ